VIAGNAVFAVILCGPAPRMAKTIVSWPAVRYACSIAVLSDPRPESFVLST
jgi:hypothetical protein